MNSFEYSCRTEIVFGEGRSDSAGELCARHGAHKVLLVHGKSFVKASGLLDRIIASLSDAGIQYADFDGVEPNPDLGSVELGLAAFRSSGCDFILSIGGGSAIDTGKAIALAAACASAEELWQRLFLGFESITALVRNAVVLTIAASGSETGESCVITNDKRKLIGTAASCQPAFVILDPINTLSLSAYQTACGAADILSHLQERYFVTAADNDLSDRFLESAMRLVIQTAEMLVTAPGSLALRSQLMWTGTIAHNALLDRGRDGGDWGCHMIEHEISARFPVVHGEGLAMLTPSWLRLASSRHECRLRLLQFASRVWGVEFPFESDFGISLAIKRQTEWYRMLGLRTSLGLVDGFSSDSADEIAASFSWQPGQFAVLSQDDIRSILLDSLNQSR